MPTHDRPALIEPRKGRRENPLPSFALVVFTSQDVESLCQAHAGKTRRDRVLFLADVHILSDSYGEVACVGPMIGAPQAAMVLEKMIALGVRRVVTLGWCGSLQPRVRIGDVVLPTGSFSEEGTSLHYLEDPGKAAPSMWILGLLREKSRETGLVFHEGKVWTTDAPYRETASKVRFYGEAGALAVEMETSALFSVAHFRGIELATILVVSDELFGGKWTHGFREVRFRQAREKLLKWIWEAAASLRENSPSRGLTGTDEQADP